MAVSPSTIKQELTGATNVKTAAVIAPQVVQTAETTAVPANATTSASNSTVATTADASKETAIIRATSADGTSTTRLRDINVNNPALFVRINDVLYAYSYTQFPLASGAAPVTVVYNEVPASSILDL